MASASGRFISPDPKPISKKLLGNPQDLNLYLYTVDNPLRYYDDDGKDRATAWQDVKDFVSSINIKLSAGAGYDVKIKVGKSEASVGVKGHVNATVPVGGTTVVKNSLSAELGAEFKKPDGSRVGESVQAEKVVGTAYSDGTTSGPEKTEYSWTDSLGIAGGTRGTRSSDGRTGLGLEVGEGLSLGAEVTASKEGADALGDAFTQVKNEIILPMPPPPTPPPPPQPSTCAPNSACPD